MKAIGNENQIVYVEVNQQKEHPFIKYYDYEYGYFGRISREAGFFEKSFYGGLTRLDKIPANVLINNKIAFLKANIIIEFASGRQHEIYFNNDDEMNMYIKREFQSRWWKELE